MNELEKRLLSEFPDMPGKRMTDGGPWTITDVGIWVPSRVKHLLSLFNKIGLWKHRNFIDLGSGDGRAVLAAALFGVHATGIEYDLGLHFVSRRKLEKFPELRRSVNMVRGDYHDFGISGFDVVFIHPDGSVPEELRRKCESEMSGAKAIFYIYHPQLAGTRALDRKIPAWIYEKK